MIFLDRAQAGRALAEKLAAYAGRRDVVVLALPRGGVPVAFEVAQALSAPLDVFVVRKLGAPRQEELALGAIASGGVVSLNEGLVRAFGLEDREIDAIVERERHERREHAYRAGLPPLDLKDRTVVLVDDGLATGSTMLAAVRAARQAGATTVVVAAPVASDEAAAMLGAEADEVIILQTPALLFAIGEWYEQFEQLEDAEVQRLLRGTR